MELEQWLVVYQAVTGTHTAKERSLWIVYAGALVAEVLLLFAFLLAMPEMIGAMGSDVRLGIACLGIVLSGIWMLVSIRLAAETRHVARLLRSMEGQFAGGEFARSLYRLAKGEQVCVSASQFTCNEWLPSVTRYGFGGRLSAPTLACLTTVLFGAGWVALLLSLLIA